MVLTIERIKTGEHIFMNTRILKSVEKEKIGRRKWKTTLPQLLQPQ